MARSFRGWRSHRDVEEDAPTDGIDAVAPGAIARRREGAGLLLDGERGRAVAGAGAGGRWRRGVRPLDGHEVIGVISAGGGDGRNLRGGRADAAVALRVNGTSRTNGRWRA